MAGGEPVGSRNFPGVAYHLFGPGVLPGDAGAYGVLLLSGRRPLRRDVQRRPDRSGLCKRCAVAHGAARRNPDTEQVSICHFDDAQQCPG